MQFEVNGNEVRVEPLITGGTIRGAVDVRQVAGPPEWLEHAVVRARQGRLRAVTGLEPADASSRCAFVLRGLPPGRWSVTLEMPRGLRRWRTLTPTEEVDVGGSVVFFLAGTWDLVRGHWILKSE